MSHLSSKPHCATHLSKAIINVEYNIDSALDTIKKGNLDFTSIAVIGVSGTIFGSIVAYKLGVPLAVIRKSRVKTASIFNIECEDLSFLKKYLVIDDLVDTGKTMKYLRRKIRESFYKTYNEYPFCAGIYLYDKNVLVTSDSVGLI